MRPFAIVTLACATLLPGAPAVAHHSFAMFDRAHAIEVTGTLQKVELVSPHSGFWVVVPDGKGGTETWAAEGTGPPRNGVVFPPQLTPGTKVNLVVFPYRDGRLGGEFIRLSTLDQSVKYQEPFLGGGVIPHPPKR